MPLTRSDEDGARTATSRRPPKIPGETGIWVFIFGDLLLFAYLFLLYLYYRGGGACPESRGIWVTIHDEL